MSSSIRQQICSRGSARTFPGTDLVDCSFLAADIRQCQAKGKIVTLSLGGATSSVGFSSESQATEFATTLWNMFLGMPLCAYDVNNPMIIDCRRKYVAMNNSFTNVDIASQRVICGPSGMLY